MAQINCTYCVERPVLASKHCVQCDTPLCDTHLAAHNKRHNHVLIDPTLPSEEWRCSEHNARLKYYCKTDRSGLCKTCITKENHRWHKVENLNVFAARRKEKLKQDMKRLKVKREAMRVKINFMKNHKKAQEEKAGEVRKIVVGLVGNVTLQLETLQHKVKRGITTMSDEVVQAVTEDTMEVEEQVNQVHNKIVFIEELCKMNNFTFLKRLKEADPLGIHDDNDNKMQISMFEATTILEILHKKLLQLADGLIERLLKEDFMRMNRSPITLNVNTAHYKIHITEDLRSAFYTTMYLTRYSTAERFKTSHVISDCTFSSGSHYWEVEVKGTQCSIGVAYDNIDKSSMRRNSNIGYNKESWSLSVQGTFSVWHNFTETQILTDSLVRSFGIFLEYEAGRLSFYQLCDPIRHLHTFKTTFIRPLHAAFYVGEDSIITILNESTP